MAASDKKRAAPMVGAALFYGIVEKRRAVYPSSANSLTINTLAMLSSTR